MSEAQDVEARIAAIRERAEKATPGPWASVEFGQRGEDGPTQYRINSSYGPIAHTPSYSYGDSLEADFIAAAREDVPWLVERLEESMARVKELDEALLEVSLNFTRHVAKKGL